MQVPRSKIAPTLESGMITALVLADGAPENLAATLAALVPAVVEGLVGDAVILARRADPLMTDIAEIAGANFTVVSPDADPWRAGAALARREWLLCLRAGDMPGEGWMRAVDRFLAASARGGQPFGRFSRRPLRGASVFTGIAERLAGTRTVRAGDLVRRDWLTARATARVRPGRIGAAIGRSST